VSLDDLLRRAVSTPLLRDTFRVLFGQELGEAASGWPRLVSASDHASWLHDGDAYVELARSPALDAHELGLSLSADSAARLVDALLGARVPSSLASAAGGMSEAECGVLAYAAARLLASHAETQPADTPWLVRDVRSIKSRDGLSQLAFSPAPASSGSGAPDLVWPLSIESSMGKLDVLLWLRSAWLVEQQTRVWLELSVRETVDRELLEQLKLEDVLLFEAASLTLTSEGLAGPVELSVLGAKTRASARLSRASLRVQHFHLGADEVGPTPAPERPTLELVLSARSIGLLQLAQLASGQPLATPELDQGAALLRHAGHDLARGELVSWRGTLGLRVTQLLGA
jgi:hypothetical protein